MENKNLVIATEGQLEKIVDSSWPGSGGIFLFLFKISIKNMPHIKIMCLISISAYKIT